MKHFLLFIFSILFFLVFLKPNTTYAQSTPIQTPEKWIIKVIAEGREECVQVPYSYPVTYDFAFPSLAECENERTRVIAKSYVIIGGECIEWRGTGALPPSQYQTHKACLDAAALLKNSGSPNILPRDSSENCPDWENFYTLPCRVTQGVSRVAVVFDNLSMEPNQEILFCLRSNTKECQKPKTLFDDSTEMYSGGNSSNKFNVIYNIPGDENSGVNTIFIPALCGDGENKLNPGCNNKGTDNGNYFYANKVYRISIFIAPKGTLADLVSVANLQGGAVRLKAELNSSIIRSGGFYVSHLYPEILKPVLFNPNSQEKYKPVFFPRNTTEFTVSLKGRVAGKEKFNDYFVELIGPDQDPQNLTQEDDETRKTLSKHCLFIPPTSAQTGTVSLKINTAKNKPLIEGDYYIKISDAKNGIFVTGTNQGLDGNLSADIVKKFVDEGKADLLNDSKYYTCAKNSSNFVYYHIPIRITDKPPVLSSSRISDDPKTGIIIQAPVPDPYQKENPAFQNANPQKICEGDKDSKGNCLAIPSGLGIKIHTDPKTFIADIFTILLSISGMITILVLLQAGYTLMNSGGNKEKVAAAREQITSAVVGLIFLILSTAILEFIGVNVLRIPGFGN